MKDRSTAALFGVSLFALALSAAAQAVPVAPVPSAAPVPTRTSVPTAPFYFDPAVMDPGRVIGPPPSADSAAQKADLAEVHRLHDHASAQEMEFARKDATTQNVFLYASIFGPEFNARNLPITAAFTDKLRQDASLENNILKARYQRPRPFRVGDPTLKSECGNATEYSYPSGHSMTGYVIAYALAEMVPEKAQEIMARADQFAEHRVMCSVHFLTDVQAGKLVTLEMHGFMLSNANYVKDRAAAEKELRSFLHLSAEPLK